MVMVNSLETEMPEMESITVTFAGRLSVGFSKSITTPDRLDKDQVSALMFQIFVSATLNVKIELLGKPFDLTVPTNIF